MTSFSEDDARLDQRLSLLWSKITDSSRQVRELHPRVRTLETRIDRLEEQAAQLRAEREEADQ